LALLGLLQLVRSFFALFDPISLDYSEMLVAGMSRQLSLSGSLAAVYAPPHAPYGLPGLQYPPLFIGVTTLVLKISPLTPLLVARGLAWATYTFAAILVGVAVWQETRQRWAALVAMGLPFCFWSVIIFIDAARPDPLALALSLLTACYYRRIYLKRSTLSARALLVALSWVALGCAAAFFSKQTYLACSAAIFFDLLLQQGRRRYAFYFGLVFSVLVGSGIFIINLLANGTFVGIFDPARASRFIFDKAPGFVGIFVLDHLPLLALAVSVLIWQIYSKKSGYFWPLYGGWAALACVAIVKDGAVDYYFNELAYVLCVQVGMGLAWVWPKISEAATGKQPFHTFYTFYTIRIKYLEWFKVALVVQLVIALGMFGGWGQGRDFDNFRLAYAQGQALVSQAQLQKRPVLIFADNLLLATDQTELSGDYFIYTLLVENKHANAEPLLVDLQQRRYDFVISEEFLHWPAVFQAALTANYDLQYLDGLDGRHLFKVYRRKS
jgi:hypothetical protein